jgi:hypothetical protein
MQYEPDRRPSRGGTGIGLPAATRRGPFDRILRTTDDGGPSGPGDGPDRAAVYVIGTIIGLAILLLILLLPPVSVLSGGDSDSPIPAAPGTSDVYRSELRRGMPKLPAGLESASGMFELSAPEDQQGASRITIPLKERQTDARNLALYTYVDGGWQRLTEVTLASGGEAARGEVRALPGNIAVLKRSQATLQIAGSIQAEDVAGEQAGNALTVLHPIVFIPAEDGSVVGTRPAVPPSGYQVVPTIVTIDPEVLNNILRDPSLQATHAAEIAETVGVGNYQGINIDYRSVDPNLREQYTTFIRSLAQALHAASRSLTLTLPLPASVDGEIDTGAYDWQALGAVADTIEMSGELDQDLYFQRTEDALEYVTQQVDRSKLLMTISSLSVERGSDGLRAMPLDEALALAARVDVQAEDGVTTGERVELVATNLASSEGATGMVWDDVSRSVKFQYPGAGGSRTVWLANEFSVAFRLELAQRYELGGVVITDVSERNGADLWAAVQQLSDTGDLALTKPNAELLVPTWSASTGAIDPSAGATVAWLAPAEPGPQTITLILSDGVVRRSQELTIEVLAP